MYASPKSNICINGPTNGCPSNDDDNDDAPEDFKITKELYYKIMAYKTSVIKQQIRFKLSCYPDGANGSMYMLLPSFYILVTYLLVQIDGLSEQLL